VRNKNDLPYSNNHFPINLNELNIRKRIDLGLHCGAPLYSLSVAWVSWCGLRCTMLLGANALTQSLGGVARLALNGMDKGFFCHLRAHSSV